MSETLVFEYFWSNGKINVNGYEFTETISYEEFLELKARLLEPFLDDELYRIEELKASCFHRVSILRKFPESFEVNGFRPISFVYELPQKAEGQHCLMITIPGSVEEALELREEDQMVWDSYHENKVILEVRHKKR
jgi:hypothetical protein